MSLIFQFLFWILPQRLWGKNLRFFNNFSYSTMVVSSSLRSFPDMLRRQTMPASDVQAVSPTFKSQIEQQMCFSPICKFFLASTRVLWDSALLLWCSREASENFLWKGALDFAIQRPTLHHSNNVGTIVFINVESIRLANCCKRCGLVQWRWGINVYFRWSIGILVLQQKAYYSQILQSKSK